MKRITAIIQPFKLDDLEEAVLKVGVPGMTVTEVMGVGRQRGLTDCYRGTTYVVDFRPKLQVEIVVERDDAYQVVTAIEAVIAATRSGSPGDGKIFVEELQSVISIRTGPESSQTGGGMISEGVEAAFKR